MSLLYFNLALSSSHVKSIHTDPYLFFQWVRACVGGTGFFRVCNYPTHFFKINPYLISIVFCLGVLVSSELNFWHSLFIAYIKHASLYVLHLKRSCSLLNVNQTLAANYETMKLKDLLHLHFYAMQFSCF